MPGKVLVRLDGLAPVRNLAPLSTEQTSSRSPSDTLASRTSSATIAAFLGPHRRCPFPRRRRRLSQREYFGRRVSYPTGLSDRLVRRGFDLGRRRDPRLETLGKPSKAEDTRASRSWGAVVVRLVAC